jgi:glycosyltransferase involved in cell wall biosynthesis
MRDRLLAVLRRLWRRLPSATRSRIVFGGVQAIAPRASRPAPVRPGPVVVAGMFGSASGIGESARLCSAALRNLDLDVETEDITGFFQEQDLAPVFADEGNLPDEGVTAGGGGTLILHINSPSVPYAAFRLGRRTLAGRRIIGCWVWELPQAPPEWQRGLRYVHEIWVPSRFVAEALPASADVPVKVVPYPVAVPAAASARDRFGLPADAFIVLVAFDMHSGYVRKNPRAAIAAFRRAFGNDRRCLLLLKIGHADTGGWAAGDLREALSGMGNVRLMRETLTREAVSLLTASADVVLSLHRAEGFGLVLAEAMLLGVPVVATGWSGNLDFMTENDSALVSYRLVPVVDPHGPYSLQGVRWAEPDIEEAAAWLRRFRSEGNLASSLAEKGRQAASSRLSLAAYRQAIGDSRAPPRR